MGFVHAFIRKITCMTFYAFTHLHRLLGNLYCCIKTYYKFLNEIIRSLLIVNSNTNSISLPINSLESPIHEMKELINLDPSVEMST